MISGVLTYSSTGYDPQSLLQSLTGSSNYSSSSKPSEVAYASHGEQTSSSSLSETFSDEILRRLAAQQSEEAASEDGGETAGNAAALGESLADALNYIEENFGEDAASAARGLILQKTSSGITEDSLSSGLLSVIKMVDSAYGFSAGDKVISKFNGALNNSLNEYFDNGYNEKFMAAPVGTSAALQAISSGLSDFSAVYGGEAGQSLLSIIQQTGEDGGLRQSLTAWMNELNETYGEEAVSAASSMLSQNLSGLSSITATPGAMLDVVV
jgi:hypothetical protein